MKRMSAFFIGLAVLLFSSCGDISRFSGAQSSSLPESRQEAPSRERARRESEGRDEAAGLPEDEGLPHDAPQLVEKSFGQYTLPLGWFESKELSQPDYFFYLKEGTSLDRPTSNISVSEGTNRYAADDYYSFAQAIDRQMKGQATEDVIGYSGDGTFTESGIPLIIIRIEDAECVSTQYYLVGDYRFVMVHSTDFHDEAIPEVDDAARSIVESFEWFD